MEDAMHENESSATVHLAIQRRHLDDLSKQHVRTSISSALETIKHVRRATNDFKFKACDLVSDSVYNSDYGIN